MKKTLSVIITVLILLSTFTVFSSAASSDVSVSDMSSFKNALSSVADGGTITLTQNITLSSSFSWSEQNKTVTITGTGKTLDMSAITDMTFGNNVIFDDVNISFNAEGSVYANGHSLTINENVTVTNAPTLYGGGKENTTVASTSLTILSGDFYDVFGGSNGGTVIGNTYVHVGGNFNSGLTISHDHTYSVFGGGNGSNTVGGNTYVTVDGRAKSNYIYAGSLGASSVISGSMNLTFGENAEAMSLYGASQNANTGSLVNLIMTGGECEQVFGGCEDASLEADVYVKLIGGTVIRRVYGGCYNNYSMSISNIFADPWKSTYKVTGMITLIIGEKVELKLSYFEGDTAVYARSRYKSARDGEKSRIVFIGETAYNTHKDNLGSKGILSVVKISATDATHRVSYSVNDNVITETCDLCDSTHSTTATLSVYCVHNGTSCAYNGSAHECAKVEFSDTWMGGKDYSLSYENNIKPGNEATASLTIYEQTDYQQIATLNFTINKGTKDKPNLSWQDESYYGRKDGIISNLSSTMEYSTDGVSYTKITSNQLTGLAPGTYYIRYLETNNYNASESAEITIKEGRKLRVTFKAEDSADIVKEVAYGATLTDIPTVPTRNGYTETPPRWNRTSFSNITGDITVTAIYTKDKETQSAPVLLAKNETYSKQGDGKIVGLTLEMEYSTDQNNYIPVSDTSRSFTPGTYYVRYAGSDTKHPSPITTVNIAAGRKIKVTFKIDGQTVEEKELDYNGSIFELPTIPPKDGTIGSYWDISVIENVKSDITVTAVYTTKQSQTAPHVSKINESIAGKGDGVLTGLSSDMEYSTDGETYLPITASTLSVTPGTYYVRYKETDDKYASPCTVLTVEAGRMLKVRFVADGKEILVVEVEYNGSVTDNIPEIPAKDGYTETPPVWSITDITNVESNITVTAKYTKDPEKAPQTPPITNENEPEEPALKGTSKETSNVTQTDISIETDKVKADDTSKPVINDNSVGCNGTLTGNFSIVAVLTLAGVIFKKKED